MHLKQPVTVTQGAVVRDSLAHRNVAGPSKGHAKMTAAKATVSIYVSR